MDAVLGSWKLKQGTQKNLDVFFKAVGIPDAAAEMYSKREVLLTFTKDGDKYTLTEVINNDPNKKSASYTVQMGKEIETIDIDDTPLKLKVQWDGSKFQETYLYPQLSPILTQREVAASLMKVAKTANGVTATEEWEKY
ncbi:hypothetical protein EGW08_011523 [Elysia chlorotica]|uniref:Lipocalin/cytosolic fatty-acid binding domain-containing protein n=1 Tax=Elysia chlorotica TaxID=188477 RepID=A0A433TGK7_ELYCH|nr:hypothetical protein EGW08_011523 [Elysia chlorotica]